MFVYQEFYVAFKNWIKTGGFTLHSAMNYQRPHIYLTHTEWGREKTWRYEYKLYSYLHGKRWREDSDSRRGYRLMKFSWLKHSNHHVWMPNAFGFSFG